MHCRSLLRCALLPLAIAACGIPAEPRPPASLVTVTPPRPAPAAARPPKALPPRDPLVGPHREKASLMEGRVKIVSPSGGEQIIEPAELHPPSGDPSLIEIRATALLFLDDGTLLVGVGDGTVTALDGSRRRRWSLGFRGAIRGLTPAGEGLIAVTTESGFVALVTGDGRLRWERQITPEILAPPVIGPGGVILAAGPRGVLAFSPGGELIFSHGVSLGDDCCGNDKEPPLSIDAAGVATVKGQRFRLDDAHPAIPPLEPTFPMTYRKVLGGNVVSLLATGPNVLLALVQRSLYQHEVVRIEGDRSTRIPLPERASRSEVFDEGEKPERAWIWTDALVAGPNGAPWIVGRRMFMPRKTWYQQLRFRYSPGISSGHVLELRGGVFRDRDDLFEAFSQHTFPFHQDVAAAPDGPGKLLCFGDESPACAAYDGSGFRLLTPPGKVVSVSRIGDGAWLSTDKGELFRSDGTGFQAVSAPKDIRTVTGTSDRDVWTNGRSYTIFHHDGARWTEMGIPYSDGDVFARTADDVWSKDGRAHWDGSRWSLIYGVPPATTLIARNRDDVWLGGPGGLWHGTAPGLSPVRLPAPASPDMGALPAPPPLPLGAPETGYVVERTRFAVAGGEPITTAKSVSAAADGTLWVETWDRVIEVDGGGKATTLRRGERLSFDRWFYPEAQGRGVILERQSGTLNSRDSVQRIEGRKTIAEGVQLDHHDAVAVHGHASGSTWVAGTFASESPWSMRGKREYELSAHALVRGAEGGFRPVLRLPSASFCDVAAAPDGGAWFAGALNSGPMGEGILFHARGRLGSEATSRFRAPATLLAVAAFGPDEAWSVGAAGTVVHVAGGKVTRYALGSRAWLRAVAGSGPNDVWIGGDGGTLLHYDGRDFHAVAHPLGERAAVTGIAISGGAVWAVGPSGMLRITKRP